MYYVSIRQNILCCNSLFQRPRSARVSVEGESLLFIEDLSLMASFAGPIV